MFITKYYYGMLMTLQPSPAPVSRVPKVLASSLVWPCEA